jgi:DNA-binding transcriptional regulator YbjK
MGTAKRDPARTRETILQAATIEFSEHGIGGARIDQIARRSGSNKRMIYHYFGDKEGLYVEVLDHVFCKMLAAEHLLDLDGLGSMEGVEMITRFVWRYFLANPEILNLLGTENLCQAKFIARAPSGKLVNQMLVKRLEILIRQGVEDGTVRDDADALKVFFTAVSLSFFYLSNRYTLSTIFNRNLGDVAMLSKWESHIVHVVARSLV